MKWRVIKILVFLGIVGFFAYFIKKNLIVIEETLNVTLANLTWYVFVALGLCAISYLLIIWAYLKIFSIVEIKRKFSQMLPLYLSGMAVNVIIPMATVSSAMVYAEDASEKGESKSAAITGFLLNGIADYTAIFFILGGSLIYLWFIKNLSTSLTLSALTFAAITGVVYLLMWSSSHRFTLFERIITKAFTPVSKIFIKLLKKPFNVHESVKKFLFEFAGANQFVIQNKKEWSKSVGIYLLSHFVRIVALYVVFYSLGYEITYRALFAGYAVGTLFLVLSPTPYGIGFVEGLMTITYTSLGVPAPIATAAVLIYRSLVFWIPFLIGFITLQGTRLNKVRKDSLDIGA